MAVDISLAPLAAADFGPEQARHLLSRAGFGGTWAQIDALVQMGPRQAVDLVVDYEKADVSQLAPPDIDPDLIRPPTPEERSEMARARRDNDEETQAKYRAERLQREYADRNQRRDLGYWWVTRMIQTPRPLEEKLTLLWHGHFASNYRTVRDSNLMWKQNELFRTHAAGNFADLARAIVRDPAMLRFLDNNTNRKQHPNENLARELMELFTLGRGNYTEDDIKQGARALTGYDFDDNDFVYRKYQHDEGNKSILGRSGDFDGEGFVDLILRQGACARFVAYKLYKHFVADVANIDDLAPAGAVVVDQLAQKLRAENYALRPVLKTLFASKHFYDPASVGGMIKSPTQLLVGTVRQLNTPLRDMGTLATAMNLMGQELFDPPTVAGWDGGKLWINSTTVFVRENLALYLLTGARPTDRPNAARYRQGDYDPTPLVAGVDGSQNDAVVDRLLATLLPGAAAQLRRDEVRRLYGQLGGKTDAATLTPLLVFITALPEYQLC